MGSFQIRIQFGSISDHQISSSHQETLFFNSVPNSARVFPFKMHGGFSNSDSIQFHLGSSDIFSSSRDFIFSIRCQIRQGVCYLKCMGSVQIRIQFGSISDHQIASPHQETLYLQFRSEFVKGFPI